MFRKTIRGVWILCITAAILSLASPYAVSQADDPYCSKAQLSSDTAENLFMTLPDVINKLVISITSFSDTGVFTPPGQDQAKILSYRDKIDRLSNCLKNKNGDLGNAYDFLLKNRSEIIDSETIPAADIDKVKQAIDGFNTLRIDARLLDTNKEKILASTQGKLTEADLSVLFGEESELRETSRLIANIAAEIASIEASRTAGGGGIGLPGPGGEKGQVVGGTRDRIGGALFISLLLLLSLLVLTLLNLWMTRRNRIETRELRQVVARLSADGSALSQKTASLVSVGEFSGIVESLRQDLKTVQAQSREIAAEVKEVNQNTTAHLSSTNKSLERIADAVNAADNLLSKLSGSPGLGLADGIVPARPKAKKDDREHSPAVTGAAPSRPAAETRRVEPPPPPKPKTFAETLENAVTGFQRELEIRQMREVIQSHEWVQFKNDYGSITKPAEIRRDFFTAMINIHDQIYDLYVEQGYLDQAAFTELRAAVQEIDTVLGISLDEPVGLGSVPEASLRVRVVGLSELDTLKNGGVVRELIVKKLGERKITKPESLRGKVVFQTKPTISYGNSVREGEVVVY